MATASATDPTMNKNYINPDQTLHDTLRRHLKRMLPVRLTRDEQTDIAIAASKKRLAVKQLEVDLDAEKKRRQAQINEIQREVDVADRELATGEQERNVMCNEIFRDGMVYVVRTDTWEAFESRPATAQEAQRFLPAVEAMMQPGPTGPLLDQAAAAQGNASASDEAPAGADADDADDDADSDVPEDDGLTELTPAQIAARESQQNREKRRKAGAKAGRGKAK